MKKKFFWSIYTLSELGLLGGFLGPIVKKVFFFRRDTEIFSFLYVHITKIVEV
jgi:hypothetical protein